MGYRKWTDEQLIEAVKNSKNLSEVAFKIGLKAGASFRYIYKHIDRLALDDSHFLSKRNDNIGKSLADDEIFIKNSKCAQVTVKKRILKNQIIEYICKSCNIIDWNNKELTLHLDHINGKNDDNRIENLRFLCPNCHSQTDSYCLGQRRKLPPKKCVDCKKIINRQSNRCVPCASVLNLNRDMKINWPGVKELKKMIEEFGCLETGRILGVSDTAIYKHIENDYFNKFILIKFTDPNVDPTSFDILDDETKKFILSNNEINDSYKDEYFTVIPRDEFKGIVKSKPNSIETINRTYLAAEPRIRRRLFGNITKNIKEITSVSVNGIDEGYYLVELE